jgi:hypothetical protein
MRLTLKDNKKLLLWIAIILAIAICSILYLPQGLEDKNDDLWLKLDTVLVANSINNAEQKIEISDVVKRKYHIPDVMDSLPQLANVYSALQSGKEDSESFDSIIHKPFPLLDDYDKFTNFLNYLIDKKKVVVEGISGSGKSTIIDRVSRIITGKSENILKLECVEKLEVEYHKEYVGQRLGDKFIPGKLLNFLLKARNNPKENFIFIIDDVDKIYPSALLGSDIWKELDNSVYDTYIDGYPHEITIPDNLYIMSVTHSDVGNIIAFNAEHFRRLGELYKLNSNYRVLLLFIKNKLKGKDYNYSHLKKLLFTFIRTNEYIENNYGTGYTLGQWSNLRKKIKPEEFTEFRALFIDNVNAFKPQREMHLADLNDFMYVIDTDGKVPRSSDLAYLFYQAKDTGIFSELSVGLLFALVSGIAGLIILRRRKKFIERQNFILIHIQADFEEKKITYDEAMTKVIEHKNSLKGYVKDGKIKYEEYIYFSIYIDDILNKFEQTQNAYEVTAGFDKTFEEFMVDGRIDESEYIILNKFLNNMKSALPPDIFYSIKNRIDNLFKDHQSGS